MAHYVRIAQFAGRVPKAMPCDAKRMIFGGFKTVVEK
jgi:uncharacterized protein YbaA (DUF1428 family)